MSLDAAENLVYLKGHKGPHPEAYHQAVYRSLSAVLRDASPWSNVGAVCAKHSRLADEVCTPGSRLYRLVTKSAG